MACRKLAQQRVLRIMQQQSVEQPRAKRQSDQPNAKFIARESSDLFSLPRSAFSNAAIRRKP
jgi:hypothetical protein